MDIAGFFGFKSGGSNASTTLTTNNESNLTYITENDYNQLYSNTSEAVANAAVTNNNSCSSSNLIDQVIDLSNMDVGGDVNFTNVKQTAKISVDFSCINIAKAEQEMAQAAMSELMNKIQNSSSQNALNAMNTRAEAVAAATTTGPSFLSGSSGSATNSTVNNTYNLKNVTTNNQNIQTVLKNIVNTNFKTENINSCIHDMATKQKILFSGTRTGRNFNFSEVLQDSSINGVVKCVNQAGVIQSVVQEATSKLGIVVENETKSTSTNEMKTEQKGSSTATLDVCGCGSIFGALGAAGGVAIAVIVGLLCVCLCIVLIVFVFLFMPSN
jgi:hypothetical protein